MNKKLISILIFLMMILVIIPITSAQTSEIKSEKPSIPLIKIMPVCIIDISGDGQLWSIPGIVIWKIDSGIINITYLGGVYNATSGRGMFILHLGSKTQSPVSVSGFAAIGIIFNF